MNVKELREKLSEYADDTEVHFSYDYRDRNHTLVTEEVVRVRSTEIVYSDYHDQTKIADDSDYDDSSLEVKTVVVLS